MTRDRPTTWTDAEPEDEVMAGLLRARTGGRLAGPPCPAPELVQASKMGTLPEPLQARVAGHLERCVVCQALVEALEDPVLASFTPEDSTRILTRVRTEVGRIASHVRHVVAALCGGGDRGACRVGLRADQGIQERTGRSGAGRDRGRRAIGLSAAEARVWHCSRYRSRLAGACSSRSGHGARSCARAVPCG